MLRVRVPSPAPKTGCRLSTACFLSSHRALGGATHPSTHASGSAWESNPPAPLCVTHSSFEDCEAHRDLCTPLYCVLSITSWADKRQVPNIWRSRLTA